MQGPWLAYCALLSYLWASLATTLDSNPTLIEIILPTVDHFSILNVSIVSKAFHCVAQRLLKDRLMHEIEGSWVPSITKIYYLYRAASKQLGATAGSRLIAYYRKIGTRCLKTGLPGSDPTCRLCVPVGLLTGDEYIPRICFFKKLLFERRPTKWTKVVRMVSLELLETIMPTVTDLAIANIEANSLEFDGYTEGLIKRLRRTDWKIKFLRAYKKISASLITELVWNDAASAEDMAEVLKKVQVDTPDLGLVLTDSGVNFNNYKLFRYSGPIAWPTLLLAIRYNQVMSDGLFTFLIDKFVPENHSLFCINFCIVKSVPVEHVLRLAQSIPREHLDSPLADDDKLQLMENTRTTVQYQCVFRCILGPQRYDQATLLLHEKLPAELTFAELNDLLQLCHIHDVVEEHLISIVEHGSFSPSELILKLLLHSRTEPSIIIKALKRFSLGPNHDSTCLSHYVASLHNPSFPLIPVACNALVLYTLWEQVYGFDRTFVAMCARYLIQAADILAMISMRSEGGLWNESFQLFSHSEDRGLIAVLCEHFLHHQEGQRLIFKSLCNLTNPHGRNPVMTSIVRHMTAVLAEDSVKLDRVMFLFRFAGYYFMSSVLYCDDYVWFPDPVFKPAAKFILDRSSEWLDALSKEERALEKGIWGFIMVFNYFEQCLPSNILDFISTNLGTIMHVRSIAGPFMAYAVGNPHHHFHFVSVLRDWLLSHRAFDMLGVFGPGLANLGASGLFVFHLMSDDNFEGLTPRLVPSFAQWYRLSGPAERQAVDDMLRARGKLVMVEYLQKVHQNKRFL